MKIAIISDTHGLLNKMEVNCCRNKKEKTKEENNEKRK